MGQPSTDSAPGWHCRISSLSLLASESRQIWHRHLLCYAHFPLKQDLVVFCEELAAFTQSKYFYYCPLLAVSLRRVTDDGAKRFLGHFCLVIKSVSKVLLSAVAIKSGRSNFFDYISKPFPAILYPNGSNFSCLFHKGLLLFPRLTMHKQRHDC